MVVALLGKVGYLEHWGLFNMPSAVQNSNQ